MDYSTPEKRKLYRRYYTTCDAIRTRYYAERGKQFKCWLMSDRIDKPPRDNPPPCYSTVPSRNYRHGLWRENAEGNTL